MPEPQTINGITYTMFWRDIPYREKRRGSPKESFARDMSRGQRTIWIPWEHRVKAVPAFLGYTEVRTLVQPDEIFQVDFSEDAFPAHGDVPAQLRPGLRSNYLHRVTPWPHPDWPGYLYASSISELDGEVPADALGLPGRNDRDVGQFDEARLTINFEAPKFFIKEDEEVADASGVPVEWTMRRYVTFREDATARAETVPTTGAMRWVINDSPLGPPGPPMALKKLVTFFESEITVIWHDVPINAYPEETIRQLVGTSNLNPFGFRGTPFGVRPPETLLFGQPSKEVTRLPNGDYAFNIQMKWKYFPMGVNKFYWFNPNVAGLRPGFYRGTHDGTYNGVPMYPARFHEMAFIPEAVPAEAPGVVAA